ncbi:hypothetical protein ACQVQT_24505 [Bacillus paranthracis]|uniref:Uncharacterized protein n=2 Tax=Bacillus paranthracis TaxID=2026186 RepID=A0A5M9GIM4_9BACI|nr:hypothetical protein [Bacillus paranthracis]QPA47808.1 hypothetical protein INQ58_28630 [Bacillus cereus]KAA8473661.1 hypothetical protein FYW06_26440 [Bacillus paranthracis]MCM0005586.1 hypothetical protein [Bacillus paranthracis]MCU5020245.1 hypothetical protein [Bacillus paranthracis]QPA42054.1 hypothetical protein INR14_28630 [Bacillus paranthracis]
MKSNKEQIGILNSFIKPSWRYIKLSFHILNHYHILTALVLITLFSSYIFLFNYNNFQDYNLNSNFKEVILNVLHRFNLTSFSDIQIFSIINSVSKSLTVIFSLVITLYIFTFREQKGISPSASYKNDKNKLVLWFMSILLYTMSYSFILSINFSVRLEKLKLEVANQIKEMKLSISAGMYPLILIWGLLIIISLVFVGITLWSLFNSMNVNYMLKRSIKTAEKDIKFIRSYIDLYFSNDVVQKKYSHLHFNIESIYQSLKYTAENNMNKEFDDRIGELCNVLKVLNDNYNNVKVSSHLLMNEKNSKQEFNRSKSMFLDFNSTILKNTLTLINYLYKNHHYNKGKVVLEMYFSMYSKNAEPILRKQFIESLDELLSSTDLNNAQKLNCILNGLTFLLKDDVFIIYKKLIIKLISHENVKLLTSVVYALKSHILDEDGTETINNNPITAVSSGNPSSSLDGEEVASSVSVEFKRDIKLPNPEIDRIKYLKDNVVIILLQCLLKSIEISHYSSTGFLIKCIVTNFQSEELNRGFKTLETNPDTFTSFYEDYDDGNEVKDEIAKKSELNSETYNYCLKKLYIMLYAQQKFAVKNKLWFIDSLKEFEYIDYTSVLNKCDYLPYLLKKIYAAGSKYGLSFLQDKNFLREIMLELKMNKKDIARILQ